MKMNAILKVLLCPLTLVVLTVIPLTSCNSVSSELSSTDIIPNDTALVANIPGGTTYFNLAGRITSPDSLTPAAITVSIEDSLGTISDSSIYGKIRFFKDTASSVNLSVVAITISPYRRAGTFFAVVSVVGSDRTVTKRIPFSVINTEPTISINLYDTLYSTHIGTANGGSFRLIGDITTSDGVSNLWVNMTYSDSTGAKKSGVGTSYTISSSSIPDDSLRYDLKRISVRAAGSYTTGIFYATITARLGGSVATKTFPFLLEL